MVLKKKSKAKKSPRFKYLAEDKVLDHGDIDNQHDTLFFMIEGLVMQIGAEGGAQSGDAIFKLLEDYTANHFDYEESRMAALDFPDAKIHLAQHQFFRDQVQKTKDRYDKTSTREQRLDLAVETMTFLEVWLETHIATIDRQLTDFLRTKEAS